MSELINPYELSLILSNSASMSSFFEDDVLIKVVTEAEGEWILKGRSSKGVLMIYPTDYNTLMFSIPVIEVPTDRMVMTLIAQMDGMNGVLNLLPSDDGNMLLMYTAYIPIDFTEFEEYGQTMKGEVKYIRNKLNNILSSIMDSNSASGSGGSASELPEMGPGFNADSFNKMMKEIVDKAGATKPPKPDKSKDNLEDEDKE